MGYLSKGDRITQSEQDIIDTIGALGTPLYVLRVNAAGTGVEWSASGAGTGDVTKVGTPVDNQVGVWTGDGTLEGSSALTFDGTTLDAPNISIDNTGNIKFGTVSLIYGNGTGGTVSFGTGAADGIIQSTGDRDLILRTGNLTTGSITIADGADANISLTPNGSGKNVLANAQITSLTASEIVITDASKNLVSAAVATYPSLTELTYVKGVTSAIQTQLNGKATIASPSFTGAVSITTSDASNLISISIAQNDITNNPTALFVTSPGTGSLAILENTNAGAVGSEIELYHNSASPASSDDIGIIYFNGKDSSGNKTTYAKISGTINDTTDTSEDGLITLTILDSGADVNIYFSSNLNAFCPGSSDVVQLGHTSYRWTSLYLEASSEIDFGGDVTLTHSSNVLTLAGGNLAVGSNSITMTGSIAATGARVAKGWFTDIESTNMPTVGGSAILSSLTDPQFTTIELGHATDTTLSRVSAGVVAIEGVNILTTAGGTLTGNLVLGENTSIDFDPAGSADGKYSGFCITGTAGAALSFGQLIYLAVADSRWELADADATATAGTPLLGMCVLAAAGDGSATKILLQGTIRADAQFPALTVGAPAYVGETAGAIQTAIPTGADNVIRVVGRALTADELYFCPSQDHQVTVA